MGLLLLRLPLGMQSAWYSNDPGAYSDLGRPAAAAASRSFSTASALRRAVS